MNQLLVIEVPYSIEINGEPQTDNLSLDPLTQKKIINEVQWFLNDANLEADAIIGDPEIQIVTAKSVIIITAKLKDNLNPETVRASWFEILDSSHHRYGGIYITDDNSILLVLEPYLC